MRMVAAFDFRVMLESKVKDLVLIRLRPDLLGYAPDVAERVGMQPTGVGGHQKQEDAAMDTG